ncbi:MAG: glycine-rich domain-containing protein, partial [bacterium]
SGGALINSASSTTSIYTGPMLLTADSSMGGAGNLNILGAISGSSKALTKVGAGTVTLGNQGTMADGTGGTITHVGGYTIHTFTSSGTFTPGAAGNVEVLVVGGGGGGGSNGGGGGGAGGVQYNSSFGVTAQAYSVTVGGGGSKAATANVRGDNGTNSVFNTITATGGGGGASRDGGGAPSTGGSGGAGANAVNLNSAARTGAAGTAGQGNTGGNGPATDLGASGGGGGGGGAGAVGTAGAANGGNGGVGVAYSISGSSVYYAGGGRGGVTVNGSAGSNGTGGGTGVDRDANSGGGGGGGNAGGGTGGNGGSGIVIVRYLTATTYSGNTTISAGTLALAAGSSIASTPKVSIAASATFDVSALASGFTFTGSSPQQTLAGSSASGTGTITAGTGAKKVTLNSSALLSFQAAGGSSTTVGRLSVTGDLTLNANAVTVNVTGSALAAGTYRLLDCSGTLANTGTFGTPTISGTALSSGYSAAISVATGSSGHVDLIVKATPVFSGLTATPSITYGDASVALSGTLSSTGGSTTVYPASGDTVSATINGHQVNGAVDNTTGHFSITYNDTSLKTDGYGTHTITYAYAGNSAVYLNAAANDASTSLTVNKAALTVTPNPVSTIYNGTTLNNTTYSAATANYSITGFKNNETVSSAGVTLAGSLAFNGSTSTTVKDVGTYTQTAGTLALTANNYSMSFVNTTPNNYVITPKALTAVGTLVFPASKVYDGTMTATPSSGSAALQPAEATSSGNTSDGIPYTGNGDAVSLTGTAAYDYNSKDVASATTITESGLSLTGDGYGNYTLTHPSFTSKTITRAPLTATADSKIRQFGKVNLLTASYDGFVNGEDASVLTTPVALYTVANQASAVDTYDITASGAVAANYSITYNPGKLVIVNLAQTGANFKSPG